MYITKQAEQQIYLIAQESNNGAPLPTHTHIQLPKLPVGVPPQLFWKWPQKHIRSQEQRKEKRKKKKL